MNTKWLGFLIFVWLIGIFIGGTYEADLGTQLGGSEGTKAIVESLLSPSESKYSGTIGNTTWWAANPNYWKDWLRVLTLDFPFLKPYDVNQNKIIDAAEKHNNDIGVYASYFVHAFGIIGLAALIFAMFEFFQGFLPWS